MLRLLFSDMVGRLVLIFFSSHPMVVSYSSAEFYYSSRVQDMGRSMTHSMARMLRTIIKSVCLLSWFVPNGFLMEFTDHDYS